MVDSIMEIASQLPALKTIGEQLGISIREATPDAGGSSEGGKPWRQRCTVRES